MASITDRGNGRRAIQFDDLNGVRRTVGLGKCPKRDAEAIKTKIEALIASKLSGQPWTADVAEWVGSMPSTLATKIASFGLISICKPVEAPVTTVTGFVAEYIASRVDVKPRTILNYQQAEKRLAQFFGSTKEMTGVSSMDADRFSSWLRGDKNKGAAGLGENSARTIIKNAKLFFNSAFKGKLITENPFTGHKTALRSRPERIVFIDQETTRRVLAACPTTEWKAIFALCRYGGLRCPSEIFKLRWHHIDWKKGRFLVTSPKTERYDGGESRTCPLFPELREVLQELYLAPVDSEFVVRKRRCEGDTNLRTTFSKIVAEAEVKPWCRPFQNLRSSRIKELLDCHDLHVVTTWLGNTPDVAMEFYLKVLESDFDKAIVPRAAPALRDTSEPTCNDPNGVESENDKPLVLQEKPTKEGVSDRQRYPRQESKDRVSKPENEGYSISAAPALQTEDFAPDLKRLIELWSGLKPHDRAAILADAEVMAQANLTATN